MGNQVSDVLKMANRGCPDSMFNLALQLESQGKYREAFRWYENAMQLGNISARFNIGKMYASGVGASQDIRRAVELFQSAAKQGHVGARKMMRGGR